MPVRIFPDDNLFRSEHRERGKRPKAIRPFGPGRKSARWDCAAAVVALAALLWLTVGAALAQNGAPAAGAEPSGSAGVTAPADATPPKGEVTVPATPGKESSAATGVSPVTAPAAASTAAPAGIGAEGRAASGSAGASAGNQADTKGAANSSPFSTLASPSNGPIKIRSDSLSIDYKKNSALWHGHVHALRADGELTSDTLQVIYGKDFHELQQMIAWGNVRISRGTQWSLSDHAVLNEASQTVILTGHPVVHDGNDQITGSKITVYLKTGESVVEGAKAVIFPRQAKTRDNGVSADHAK